MAASLMTRFMPTNFRKSVEVNLLMAIARATFLIMASRILTLLVGLFVAWFAAFSLSKMQQGYLFTFLNLAAAQSLFELGITGLILHHYSHAHALLLSAKSEIEIEQAKAVVVTARLYAFRYFLRAAVLFTGAVGVGGAVFFTLSENRSAIVWEPAWIIMVIATAIGLYNLRLYSYLEGFGQLKVSYMIRIKANVSLALFLFGFAYAFGGLSAYPAALLISNLIASLFLWQAQCHVDKEYQLSGRYALNHFDIKREQRSIALSTIAGYVAANSLTPYTFYFFGAEIAGKVGFTMSIFSAIAALAVARTTAEAPSYGHLIVGKDFVALNHCYKQTSYFSLMFATFLIFGVIAARQVLERLIPEVAERMLGHSELIVLGMLTLSSVLLAVTSTILRSFKTEPLTLPSLMAAVVCLVSQYIFMFKPFYCLVTLAVYNWVFFLPYSRFLLFRKIT